MVGTTIECPISYYRRLESLCQIQLAAEAAAKGRGGELVLIGDKEAQVSILLCSLACLRAELSSPLRMEGRNDTPGSWPCPISPSRTCSSATTSDLNACHMSLVRVYRLELLTSELLPCFDESHSLTDSLVHLRICRLLA